MKTHPNKTPSEQHWLSTAEHYVIFMLKLGAVKIFVRKFY